jgi:hypothetical protein
LREFFPVVGNGLSHALLGSLAEPVVRNAPCHVMTVLETTPQQQEKTRAAETSAV